MLRASLTAEYSCADVYTFNYKVIPMSSSTLTVRMDSTQIDRLEALAESTGRSRSFLAADAINAYLDVHEWQVAGIKKAMASMDSNGGVDHADVKNWVANWGNASASNKIPHPRKP
jgi:predicted transcriptional regulator